MKYLIINKFLYPNGGSETYIFNLGRALMAAGHQVEYFGMEHPERKVGNRVEAYTSGMDFHGGRKWEKLMYPIKTIYSLEARRKIRKVLDDFQPDVCHLNNFNYQLTPSILLEIRKWERQTNRRCKILYTAHDYQLVCPNHMCLNPGNHHVCEKCLSGHFYNCIKGRCIHGSFAKSVIGAMEGYFWRWMRVYRLLDVVICPSNFMKSKLDTDAVLAEKTVVLHNFVERAEQHPVQKGDYVLYFGRFSEEKGIRTLVHAAKALPEISFVFAGSGPLETLMEGVSNIKNVGFQSGEALQRLIREARFTVCPSEWYENCPFSVMESQLYGTPVLGANIGGIPELIRTGETGALYESGNLEDMKRALKELWEHKQITDAFSEQCAQNGFYTVDTYCGLMLEL